MAGSGVDSAAAGLAAGLSFRCQSRIGSGLGIAGALIIGSSLAHRTIQIALAGLAQPHTQGDYDNRHHNHASNGEHSIHIHICQV